MTNILVPEIVKNNYKLSSRELDVLLLMCKGKTNSEIAKSMNVTIHTVKVHVASILQKFDARDRIQAIIIAISEKLVDI